MAARSTAPLDRQLAQDQNLEVLQILPMSYLDARKNNRFEPSSTIVLHHEPLLLQSPGKKKTELAVVPRFSVSTEVKESTGRGRRASTETTRRKQKKKRVPSSAGRRPKPAEDGFVPFPSESSFSSPYSKPQQRLVSNGNAIVGPPGTRGTRASTTADEDADTEHVEQALQAVHDRRSESEAKNGRDTSHYKRVTREDNQAGVVSPSSRFQNLSAFTRVQSVQLGQKYREWTRGNALHQPHLNSGSEARLSPQKSLMRRPQTAPVVAQERLPTRPEADQRLRSLGGRRRT